MARTPYKADAPIDRTAGGVADWYATTFPNERPAELPKESQPNKWSYEELLSLPGKSQRAKRAARRAARRCSTTAQCMNCHRFNGKGEAHRPRSDDGAQRFQRKEILESIVYPNQVVSDQYASQIVTAGGKTYTGIAARNAGRRHDGAAIGRAKSRAGGGRHRRCAAEQSCRRCRKGWPIGFRSNKLPTCLRT